MDTQECKKRRFKEGQVFVTRPGVAGGPRYIQVKATVGNGEAITYYAIYSSTWYSVFVGRIFLSDISDVFVLTDLPDLLTALLTGKVLGKKANGS